MPKSDIYDNIIINIKVCGLYSYVAQNSTARLMYVSIKRSRKYKMQHVSM